MPGLSTHPVLPYLATFFGTIFTGFGVAYMFFPRSSYELYGFSGTPTTPADWEVMDRIMVLYGAKDMFMAAAIFASTWFGTRKSAGLILMAGGLCAGVDGYVVGNEAGTNHMNHWGYGSMMFVLGAVMTGILG